MSPLATNVTDSRRRLRNSPITYRPLLTSISSMLSELRESFLSAAGLLPTAGRRRAAPSPSARTGAVTPRTSSLSLCSCTATREPVDDFDVEAASPSTLEDREGGGVRLGWFFWLLLLFAAGFARYSGPLARRSPIRHRGRVTISSSKTSVFRVMMRSSSVRTPTSSSWKK